jgi:hypothetical protein
MLNGPVMLKSRTCGRMVMPALSPFRRLAFVVGERKSSITPSNFWMNAAAMTLQARLDGLAA